ncbi:hypothetical protein QBC45DRAFT_319616 [Copromyces sp. CBS 386.78]|nr:hypothetical protein QBC45DRAFT_319616 [Copromyces sp. CBS 386.78]
MSYSPLCKALFELKHEGQPHYKRKRQRNAKPTGLTAAQRHIAAPPEGGQPASPFYQSLDISQYSDDRQPAVLQIMQRPEYGTEYAELDNGFWYILEQDGSFTHMTDHELQDFLGWKKDQEDENGGNRELEMDDEALLAEYHRADESPDPSLEIVNSEIEALDAELEAVNSELGDSK